MVGLQEKINWKAVVEETGLSPEDLEFIKNRWESPPSPPPQEIKKIKKPTRRKTQGGNHGRKKN